MAIKFLYKHYIERPMVAVPNVSGRHFRHVISAVQAKWVRLDLIQLWRSSPCAGKAFCSWGFVGFEGWLGSVLSPGGEGGHGLGRGSVAWRRLRLSSLSCMAAKEPLCNYCVAGRFLSSETVLLRQCMVRFYRARASCRFFGCGCRCRSGGRGNSGR